MRRLELLSWVQRVLLEDLTGSPAGIELHRKGDDREQDQAAQHDHTERRQARPADHQPDDRNHDQQFDQRKTRAFHLRFSLKGLTGGPDPRSGPPLSPKWCFQHIQPPIGARLRKQERRCGREKPDGLTVTPTVKLPKRFAGRPLQPTLSGRRYPSKAFARSSKTTFSKQTTYSVWEAYADGRQPAKQDFHRGRPGETDGAAGRTVSRNCRP